MDVLWDPGVSRRKIASEKGVTLAPWLEFPFSTGYRTRKITIDGSDLIPSTPDRFSGPGAKKSVRSFQGTVSTVEFDRFSAGKKITLQLPGKLPGSLYESFYENAAGEKLFQAVFQLRMNPLEEKRRIRRSPELTSGRTMRFISRCDRPGICCRIRGSIRICGIFDGSPEARDTLLPICRATPLMLKTEGVAENVC